MDDILLLSLQGAYNKKVPKLEEYIYLYRDQSAGAIEFAYNTAAAADDSKMGIKKGIVDLIQLLLSRNVW